MAGVSPMLGRAFGRKISIGASLLVLILLIAIGAYIFGTRPLPIQAPDGTQLTPLRTISTSEARIFLLLTGVRGISVRNAIDLYRMNYRLTRPDGKVVPLSGLLALPRGLVSRRLVSFQHGTTTTRSAVPSKPDGTGIATAIVFAGNGYSLVVPDYPGLGDSPGRHPYYVADAIGPAIVGMLEAAEQLQTVPKTAVFLSGFSEGAWASLAALRILQNHRAPVLGSALVAGAYDLRRTSLTASIMLDRRHIRLLSLRRVGTGGVLRPRSRHRTDAGIRAVSGASVRWRDTARDSKCASGESSTNLCAILSRCIRSRRSALVPRHAGRQ
jgi:pimeloyl-ACP methyl ester carboxylesterase